MLWQRLRRLCGMGGGNPNWSAADWDQDYAAGKWDFLAGLAEVPHTAVIAGYCRRVQRGGAEILDIGCGEGVLLDALKPGGFRAYTGVDFSAVAIERAARRAVDNARFIAAAADAHVPDRAPDIVVFNEMLYYVPDAEATVRRYLGLLAPGGFLIVSIYESAENRHLWPLLGRLTTVVDRVVLSNAAGTRWDIALLQPPCPSARPGGSACKFQAQGS